MNIIILTLPLHTNYGGVLQAFALQEVLKRMGHDVAILDCNRRISSFRKFLRKNKYKIISLLKRKKCISPSDIIKLSGENIFKFVDKHFFYVKLSDLKKTKAKRFDAIIVGSDQVWRHDYAPNILTYYLDFAEKWDIKKIAYAASFGKDVWDYSEKETLRSKALLQLFSSVSVREQSAVSLCKEELDKDVELLLDPTLLLCQNDYVSFSKHESTNLTGKLFCYIMDEDNVKTSMINKLSESSSLESYIVKDILKEAEVLNGKIKPAVEFWIKCFIDAEYVFTDSYHGCVFSILYNKPFIVYGNEKRGMTRFHSILHQFGLEDRLITSLDDAERLFYSKIDWDVVNQKLAIMRQESLSFLYANLNRSL